MLLQSTIRSNIDRFVSQSIFDRIDGIGGLCQSGLIMITPAQCRAARGLLDWSQQELADRAEIGIVTVRQLEAGARESHRATLQVVRRSFESAGVEFIDENGGGPGVRLRKLSKKPGDR